MKHFLLKHKGCLGFKYMNHFLALSSNYFLQLCHAKSVETFRMKPSTAKSLISQIAAVNEGMTDKIIITSAKFYLHQN